MSSIACHCLDKWVDRWERAICREMRRMQVYNLYVEGCRAQIHLMLSICYYTPPPPSPPPPLLVSPSLPVQWQLCCPQRDDWESVALPLQSYRSTAAGVSSSALPLCSLPDLFPLFLLSSLAKLAAATCWLLWEILPESLYL